MPIFREQPSISPYEHTNSISIHTCVCKVVQQLAITHTKYLIKKLNTFCMWMVLCTIANPFFGVLSNQALKVLTFLVNQAAEIKPLKA